MYILVCVMKGLNENQYLFADWATLLFKDVL